MLVLGLLTCSPSVVLVKYSQSPDYMFFFLTCDTIANKFECFNPIIT